MTMETIVRDDMQLLQFPSGFLWGVANSAFQVEGHPFESSTRCSDWSDWTALEGKIVDGCTADQACECYSRFADDIAICRSLNLNAFRLSLNWAVLRPKAGSGFKLDAKALRYY